MIRITILILVLSAAVDATLDRQAPPPPTEQPWTSGAATVTLGADSTLRVSGGGDMADYDWRYYLGNHSPWESAVWYETAPPIRRIVVEGGITKIGDWAFVGTAGTYGLTSAAIPNSVTSIGKGAFFRCYNLASVTIPGSVKSIGYMAFGDCHSLTSIAIPDGVTIIERGTFEECVNLRSAAIPNSVTSIDTGAFAGCSSLTSITLPDGLTSIGEWAFLGCKNLTSVTIPSGVTHIGEAAFYNTGLTSIVIPKSVSYIGGKAFANCGGLMSVIFKAGGSPEIYPGAFSGVPENAIYFEVDNGYVYAMIILSALILAAAAVVVFKVFKIFKVKVKVKV